MKSLIFNSLLHRTLMTVFIIGLFILSACKDDENEAPVTVEFPSNSSIAIGEDDGASTINLRLSGAAKKDGTITISASDNATGALDFDSEISVTKGTTDVILHIEPIDNADIDGSKAITLSISDVTSAFEIGETDTYTVNITDNEGPTQADFETGSGEVAENAPGGIEVTILLSSPADVAGTVVVAVDPSTATITTVPAISDGTITIPVAVDAEEVSFVVTPVNGTDDNADYDVKFTITGATGGVEVGTISLEYVLTVNDDDDIVITSIADIKAQYSGSDVPYTTDTYVKAIVTSVSASNGNVHQNGAYIQEEEGGAILLYFTDAHGFSRGDVVQVNLNGGKLTDYNGLLEVTDIPKANATSAKVGTDDLPAYTTITISQLLDADKSSSLQSKLVKIENVSFPEADGLVFMSGTKTFTDGTNSGIMYTRSAASFSGSLVPLGSGTIQGILSNNSNVIQLLPQVFADDLFPNNPVGTIGITETIADFGSVNNGAESSSQSYTVQGTTLDSDIVITASSGFKISLTEGGTYESSVTILAASANVANTVYVKFAPTTGSDQAIAGTLTHKSQGAVSVVVNVTGIETGNGASALQTLALWTFETSPYGSSTPNKVGTESDIFTAESGILSSSSTAKGVHASSATTYTSPAGNGSSKSLSSNTWAVGDYYQFSLSSTGYSDIKISWDQMGSGTGPGSFVLQYSADGSNFTQFGTAYTVINDSWSSSTPKTTSSYSVDLSSITTLNNSTTLIFRLVVASTTSVNAGTVATGGTGRVDNVKVEGR